MLGGIEEGPVASQPNSALMYVGRKFWSCAVAMLHCYSHNVCTFLLSIGHCQPPSVLPQHLLRNTAIYERKTDRGIRNVEELAVEDTILVSLKPPSPSFLRRVEVWNAK